MSSVTDTKAGGVDAIVVISNESTSTSIGLLRNPTPEPKVSSDTPRIIGNELLVKPQAVPALDHLDELSSLELEIAKMHHVEEALENIDSLAVATSISSCFHGNKKGSINMGAPNVMNVEYGGEESKMGMKHEVNRNPIASGETSLEHEDLIAVLKGLDDAHNSSGDAELMEGVTIEGEGEYQIMEVIDDDSTAPDENITSAVLNEAISSPTKSFRAALLTNEEERALALEQMEGLSTKSRRRKQEIKPIKHSDSVMDLVSALEAEWTDTDEEVKDSLKDNSSADTTVAETETTATTKKQEIKSPLVTSVVVIPSPNRNTVVAVSSEETKTNSTLTTTSTSEPKELGTTKKSIDGIIETKTEENSHFMTTATGKYGNGPDYINTSNQKAYVGFKKKRHINLFFSTIFGDYGVDCHYHGIGRISKT